MDLWSNPVNGSAYAWRLQKPPLCWGLSILVAPYSLSILLMICILVIQIHGVCLRGKWHTHTDSALKSIPSEKTPKPEGGMGLEMWSALPMTPSKSMEELGAEV